VTRADASDAEIDSVFVWLAHRRKVIAAIISLVVAGAVAAWQGMAQIESAAEDRVLRRQAVRRQAEAVRQNGEAVRELHSRIGKVEMSMAEHTEMTRTSMELLMASPSMRRVLTKEPQLRARAAKAIKGR
jgi:uncharacterized membrane protein